MDQTESEASQVEEYQFPEEQDHTSDNDYSMSQEELEQEVDDFYEKD